MRKGHPWHVIYSTTFSVTAWKSCWKRVFYFSMSPQHNQRCVQPWDADKKKKKAGNHQSGRCVQISETFCSSLAALFSTSLIFSSILSPSIYYLTFSLQQKRAADNPRSPRFCFVKPSCRFPFPHILMSDTSCLGPWSSFTVLSSLIRHHPPSYSYFYPSVSPTSYVLRCISPFHLLVWHPDCVSPSQSVRLIHLDCDFIKN